MHFLGFPQNVGVGSPVGSPVGSDGIVKLRMAATAIRNLDFRPRLKRRFCASNWEPNGPRPYE